MTLRVIQSGITLIQDHGRPGLSDIGVSSSGAFDSVSYLLANSLLGKSGAPAFEILQGKLEFEVASTTCVSVVGNAAVFIGGNRIASNTSFQLLAGQQLLIEPLGTSPCYVVVCGLQVDQTLGSRSFDTLSAIGPAPVQTGAVFELEHVLGFIGNFLSFKPEYSVSVLHYIPGPMAIDISGDWKRESLTRTGVRLNRENPVLGGVGNLPSFPMMPGAIQVPPSGQPVILSVDSGTTGGYPVAGVVIEAELQKLSRLSETFKLEPVTFDYARNAKQKLENSLSSAVIDPNQMGSW